MFIFSFQKFSHVRLLIFCLDDKRKLICPECKAKHNIPERGVGAFPDDALMRNKMFQCMKHFSPLIFFCEECQEQVCTSCTVAKHKGHDVKELEDKANSCKTEMSYTKDKVRELSIELGSHLDQLNEAVDKVKRTTSQNLDVVDERREEIHKKIKEMYAMVQAETEKQKMELYRYQKENLEKLKKAKEETLKAKSSFDELYVDIRKEMMNMSNNEIVQKKRTVEKSFEDNKRKVLVNNEFDVHLNDIRFEKKVVIPEMKEEDIVRLCDDASFILQPAKIKEATLSTRKKLNLIPKAQETETFDTQFEIWGYTKMCVSLNGLIIFSGKIRDENWLKCFNPDGDCLWQIKIGIAESNTEKIEGLCCAGINDKYFIITTKNRIELRNFSDGMIICKRDVAFTCDHVYSTGDVILIVNVETNPIKLVQFQIKAEPKMALDETSIAIDTQMKDVFGLNWLNHRGKQLLIVTS